MTELYVVATPIGNLSDMSSRALEVLAKVDLIAAEDTRHSGMLLAKFGISAKLVSYHEHNEGARAVELIEKIRQGASVALISDAGTPLVSDPGYQLVKQAHEAGIKVIPVPGASAMVAALSVSGLPSDRFVFEGFLPAKQSARRQKLTQLSDESRTMIFYESSHRIEQSVADMAEVFGSGREAMIARELTKKFETLNRGSLDKLLNWLKADSDQQRGEFVVLVQGEIQAAGNNEQALPILKILLAELPLKQAVALAAKITGVRKNELYQEALKLSGAEG